MSITQDPLLLPEQTPHIEDSVKTNSQAKVIEKILPDPWTLLLPTAISATRLQQTPEPRLLLLPPASAPLPTVQQPAKKRRGRPRKAA